MPPGGVPLPGTPPPRTTIWPWAYATVCSEGEAVSYERGTPVQGLAPGDVGMGGYLENYPNKFEVRTSDPSKFALASPELECAPGHHGPFAFLAPRVSLSLLIFLFFTLVTGPRSLSLKLGDAIVYEPQIRLFECTNSVSPGSFPLESSGVLPQKQRDNLSISRSTQVRQSQNFCLLLQGYLVHKKPPPRRTLQ